MRWLRDGLLDRSDQETALTAVTELERGSLGCGLGMALCAGRSSTGACRRSSSVRFSWTAFWLLAGLLTGSLATAQRYTPESPEVQAVVSKGIAFLEANGQREPRLGGISLVGMALYKAGKPASHEVIQHAVSECREIAAKIDEFSTTEYPPLTIYDIGLATVFLCELDPVAYRSEIQAMFGWLLKAQKPQGAWGYPINHPDGKEHCDTSMTQYAALASWSVRSTGVASVPDSAIQELAKWLLRTQDPSGAWGYQGIDPGPERYQRVPQRELRPSLVAAGLGSLYVCADLLKLNVRGTKDLSEYPPTLRRIEAQPVPGSRSTTVPSRLVERSLEDGNRYLHDNFTIAPEEWTFYYLYALERAQSFSEWLTGKPDSRVDWYDQGVEYLRRSQKSDGSWLNQAGDCPDTAFAILFLIRSTRLSIQKAAAALEGLLRGGRGLPSETSDVQLLQGRVVQSQLRMQADKLLDLLREDKLLSESDLLAAEYVVPLSDDPIQRARQLEGLRGALHSESAAKRRAAVRMLSSERDLESVPDLIYALTDPDLEVMRAARDALRAISRRVEGMGLPDIPTPAERQRAVEAWQRWYDAVRPDGE